LNSRLKKKVRVLHTLPDLHIGGAANVLLNNLGIIDKKRFSNALVYFGSNESLLPDFKKIVDLQIYHLSYRGKSNFVRTLRKYCSIVKEGDVDIIHSNLVSDFVLSAVLSFFVSVKLIFTLHFTDDPRDKHSSLSIKYWYYQVFVSLLRNKCIKCIAVSKAAQINAIINFGLNPDSVVLIYSGTCQLSSQIPPKELIRFRDVELGLVCVARLHKVKGHHRLIPVARELEKHNASFRFFLVGEGKEKIHLEREIKSEDLYHRFLFAGFRRDIGSVLNLGDYFILPSYHEALGLSIIEAMSLGKIVFASSVGGIPELIEDGVNGFLLDFNDPSACAEKIMSVANNPDLKKKISENAYQAFIQKYDVRIAVRRYEEEYLKCLDYSV
jgi:glycosyltransferase involved in cell wall biosynthesis